MKRAILLLALFVSSSAFAATSEFRVLLDLDNDQATGCSSNAFNGAELLIVTKLEMTAPAHVTSVTRSTCSGGSFGTPVEENPGGWGVSYNSTTGQGVLETALSIDHLTVPVRIGYAIGSQPAVVVIYDGPHDRRRSIGRPASGAPITLDGNTSDWAGISPISTGANGTLYVLETSNTLFFRFDGRLTAGPKANDDTFVARQGQTMNEPAPGVLRNDVEPRGETMTAALATNPTSGTVILQADGSFTYSHDGSSSNSDSFTYTASSSSGTSDPATVTMQIVRNNPPQASNDAYTVAEGGTLNTPAPGVLGNDNDSDTPASALRASVLNGPANGILTLNSDGSFVYTHNGSETTTDSFRYRVSDGFSFGIALVTITITPVNDPPTAVADAYTTAEDTPLSILAPGVLGNDTDPDGVGMTATIVANATNGIVALSANGAFTYTPNANFFGTDSFTYNANDAAVASTTPGTVTITVTPVNDPPSFTPGANVTVVEDSAAYSAAWATAISSGPNETDPLNFIVTNDNNPLFSVQPAISPTGVLTFTPAANANGIANVTVVLGDGSAATPAVFFTITVTAVNDTPSFLVGGNVTVLEDSGAYSAAQASAISAGPADEAGQTLTFNVSNDNNALFSAQPAISAAGVLTFTPAANAFGAATITVTLSDNGAPVATTAAQTFTITLTPINDEPSFTTGGNVTVNEDSGAYSAAWATAINPGTNEATQTVSFAVSNDNNGLFSAQPAVSPTGVLTFTPAADQSGSATVSVILSDNGGTANGGDDTFATVTFTITVNPINDPPTFNQGGTVTVLEDSAAYSAAQVTAISPGPADESAQTVSFNVTNDNNALFSAQPAIDAAGVLTFTPAANAFGSATVSVTATDSGGATSTPAQTFTITITPVNDEPSFTTGGNVTVNEDSGAYSAAWATAINPGPNEGAQTVSFAVSNDNNSLFSAQPAVSSTGVLTFTPAADQSGSATVSAILSDNGGTANGGDDTFATVTFTITVNAVDDPPVVTTTGGVSSFTEAGGPIVVDNGVTVSDVDSTTLASATVTITNLLNAGLETLAANVGGTAITANYVAPILTLSGVDSLANYQQVLRTITYDNTSTSPNATPRSISFVVNDGTSNSNTATKSVTIVSINSAPVVTTSAGTTAFVEDSAAAVVDSAVTVTDSDTPTLASATVTISNLLDAGLETLAATTGATAITASYTAPTLTLSGVDSVANYQTVLQTVTYNNTSNTPSTTDRTISFRADDGDSTNNLSNIATKLVSVTPANDPPVVTTTGGSTTFTEGGGPVAVDNLVAVTDPDSATLASATVTISNLLNGGNEFLAAVTGATAITANYVAPTLTLTGVDSLTNYQNVLRSVTYENTSIAPNTTPRVIQFVANDGALNSNTATKNVVVVSINSAPVVTTTAGSTAFIEDGGAVLVDSGVTVTDGDSPTLASATVTIGGLVDTGFEFLGANVGGTSITQSYVAPTLTLSGIDTVANYETVLKSVFYNNTSNTPTISDRTIAFQVNDGTDPSNTATKVVTVVAANDAPVVTTSVGSSTFTEDGGPVTVDGAVTVTDADHPNLVSATVMITNLLDAGLETLSANTVGTLISASFVAPTLSLTGSDTVANYQIVLRSITYNNTSQSPSTTARSISFLVNDGTVNSNTATKSVTVVSVNDAPVLNDAARSIDENSANGTNVGAALPFTDADLADTHTFAITAGDPTGRFAISNTGQITVANPISYETTQSFTLTVQITDNGSPIQSDTATVTITVNDLNEAPTADDDSFANVIGNTQHRVVGGATGSTAVAFNANVSEQNPLVGDTDPDTLNAAFGTLTIVPVIDAATSQGGKITIDSDGKFTYTPPPGYTGATDFYDYTLTDGTNTDIGRLSFTVTNLVWYVKNNDAVGPFTGTSTDPFNELSDGASDALPDDAEDAVATAGPTTPNTIYVFRGDGTTTGMNQGITLDDNQDLLGEQISLIVGGTTLVTGSLPRPSIGNGAGNGVSIVVSAGNDRTNTIRGLTIAGGGGSNAIDATASGGIMNLTIDSVTALMAGAEGFDINIGGGTATIAISNVTVAATTTGIDINRTAGTARVSAFSDITIDGTTGGSGIIVNDVRFDTDANAATNNPVTGNNLIIGPGGVNPVGGAGMIFTTVSGGISFGNLFVLADGAPGAVVVSGNPTFELTVIVGSTLTANAGPALNLTNVAATLPNTAITSSNSPATGVSLTNVTGSLTASGTISNAGGTDFNISGGTANVTYNGTITDDVGQLVSVASTTGGTKSFTGAITDNDNGTGTGVSLTTNTGATITFSGGLVLSTGASNAFTATGGGIVNVCDENPCDNAATGALINKITTTTGTALNVANTTIGANNLEFRSISAGTGASGPANGIILNTTGSSGGLKVKGTGGAGSGGTIQKTTSFGVVLTSTENVEFNRFSIHDTGDRGINGSGVNNFIYRDSTIFNFDNGAHAPGLTVDAMTFTNLTGTVTIQRSTLGPDGQFLLSPFPPLPENKGIIIRNTNVANLAMTVTGTTFTQLSNDGIDAEVTGGTGTISVDGSTGDGANVFNQINGRSVNFGAPIDNSSARVLDLTVKNNTFTSVGIGGRWFAPARTTMNARFNNNTMTGTSNDAIRSEADAADGTLSPKATVNATINGNNMGGGGIFISNHRQAIANIALTNNPGIGFFGINVNSDRGSTIGIDITGNSVSVNGASPNFANAMYLQTSNNGGGASTTCANISGNTLTSTGATSAGVVLDTVAGEGTISLEGYVSGAEETYLTSVNTITGTPQVAIDDATFVNPGGNCVTSTP